MTARWLANRLWRTRLACLLVWSVAAGVVISTAVWAQNADDDAIIPLTMPNVASEPAEHDGIMDWLGNLVSSLLEGHDDGDNLEFKADDDQAQLAEYTSQFRQLLKVELLFLNAVCAPTDEQSQTIAAAGECRLKKIAEEFVAALNKMEEPIAQEVDGGTVPHQPIILDPRQRIQESLSESVNQTLSSAQVALYRAELDQRNTFRKRVVLSNLVAKLDDDLVLTAEQRRQLTDSLSTHWQEPWGRLLGTMWEDGASMPNLGDDHVLPFLTETQQEVWREIEKDDSFFANWDGSEFAGLLDILDEDEVPPQDDALPEQPDFPKEATK